MADEHLKHGEPEGGGSFDRRAYLKEIRRELLVKLGLPPNTKPEQVAKLIQIRNDMEKIKKKQ